MKSLLVVLLSLVTCFCDGSKILCISPFPGKSHTMVIEALCRELAARHHQVTIVTNFPSTKETSNYKQIPLDGIYGLLTGSDGIDPFQFRKIPNYLTLPMVFQIGVVLMDKILSHPNVVELIKSDETFDLVLSEAFVDESVYAGFSQKFKAPIAIIAPFLPNLWSNKLVGNPAPTSYIPEPFLPLHTKMTFTGRLLNTVYVFLHGLLFDLWYIPSQDAVMRKHFGDHLPPLSEIMKNVSLVLVNHHFSLAFPRPYVPNMIEVGGMTVKPPKPLPQDIQEFLDDAKEGAIFFSFGSYIETSKMPKDRLEVFLKAFSRLKLKILWKWEDDDFPGKPDNVKAAKWFPQSDILAHPNLRLFITHGGLGSTTEAIHRGVAIVGIPIFVEQYLNLKNAERSGFGKVLDFDEVTETSLYETIMEVLENKQYREASQRGSALLKDTPLSAMDTAVYWIEYVIRHKGAPHLRSSAQDLAGYQLYLLDVIAVLAATTLAFFTLSFWLVRACFRRICGSGKRKENLVKKHN